MAFTAPEDELLEEEGFSAPDDEILMEDTGQSRTESALGDFGRSLAKVGTGTVEGLGQFGSSYIRNLNPIGIAGKLGVPGVQSIVDRYSSIPESIASGASSAQQKVEEVIPVNPLYQDSISSQAAGISGQVVGQVASILSGSALTKAPKVLQILGLGQAGLLGLESGYAEADRLGVTDPWKRDAMAATFAAAEAGVEGLGGYGGQGFIKSILGQTKEALGKGAGKRFLKTVASEGIEEPITGVLQSGSANVFAEEDPNNPGYALNGEKLPSIDPTSAEFWEDRAKEAAGGAFGGGLFGVAGLIGSHPSVQDRQKALQRADLTLEIMRDKPDLTEEDRQDMEALQAERDELALDLGTDDAIAQSSQVTTDSIISSAQIARDMGMTEAAEILESIAPPPSKILFATEKGYVSTDADAASVEQSIQASEAERVAMDASSQIQSSEQPFVAPADELEQPIPQTDAIQEPSTEEMGTYPSGDQSLGRQESSEGVGQSDQREIPADQSQETAVASTKVQSEKELSREKKVSATEDVRFLEQYDLQTSESLVRDARAGDERSKNEGKKRPEGLREPVALVELPLSLFSDETREFIRTSTRPDRVKRYLTEKPETPIYALRSKKDGTFRISDGGHRLMASIDRGDSHIRAYVPISSLQEKQSPVPDESLPQATKTPVETRQIKNSRPVELNVITKSGLAKETVEASEKVKRDLINQKKLYTKLLNCLNS